MSFTYLPPTAPKTPILISVPHCGTGLPKELKKSLLREDCPDCDWFVDTLYDFAPSMGIGIIKANYSRYVVDLNRAPNNVALYGDGRLLTGVVPTTSFDGSLLYAQPPTPTNISERIDKYYVPYHNELSNRLKLLLQDFRHVLLFDAHSIKRHVPLIVADPLPDVILGNNDETTADQDIIATAWNSLRKNDLTATHNHPFKGGFITRHYSNVDKGIHTLQLEMSQDIYMESEPPNLSAKAGNIKKILKELLQALKTTLHLKNLKR